MSPLKKQATTLKDLPVDILFCIVDYLDPYSQLQTGIVSKFISSASIQKLWHKINCNSLQTLERIINALFNNSSTFYPYHDWLTDLDISFTQQTTLHITRPQYIATTALKVLRLTNIHASNDQVDLLYQLFLSRQSIRRIELEQCSREFANQLTVKQQKLPKLTRLSIEECSITDIWVKQMVQLTPKITYLSLKRSGYMSDIAILALTQHCPSIQTLIVTLPTHIVQSNTITLKSLQSLAQSCSQLKTFICRGQVRISHCQDWLYEHCLQLEHCDLSF